MADLAEEEDEELQQAFRMSLAASSPPKASQGPQRATSASGAPATAGSDTSPSWEPPEPKRSKAEGAELLAPGMGSSPSGRASWAGGSTWAKSAGPEASEEVRRKQQREQRALAAERRIAALSASPNKATGSPSSTEGASSDRRVPVESEARKGAVIDALPATAPSSSASQQWRGPAGEGPAAAARLPQTLPPRKGGKLHLATAAEALFWMVFGDNVSPEVLAQWSRQGFRFSVDRDTCLGLVQREGGPCGVLAPIQALVMKYLLCTPPAPPSTHAAHHTPAAAGVIAGSAREDLSFSEAECNRALAYALAEALWLAGESQRAVVVLVEAPRAGEMAGHGTQADEDKAMEAVLEGVTLDSPAALLRVLVAVTCDSLDALREELMQNLASFRSGLGALLVLFSALLSRSLTRVQADRDDPEQPLVTRPFGHASQEIVNLLLCGCAVANVFDGVIELGEGMRLQGVPRPVEVGFLTLLEALNLCKVGQHLKNPRWPVWVVGSESHYTVLFALTPDVQAESEAETQEARVRRRFDELDSSGGGGFISPDSLQLLLRDLDIDMPADMQSGLCSIDFVVWSEFWEALMKLDRNRGGFRGAAPPPPPRKFELHHFNGIAKSVAGRGHGQPAADGGNNQRPRLTKLRVTVPPKWTPPDVALVEKEDCTATSAPAGGADDGVLEWTADMEEPALSAPLVDCIRTRWQRATCSWTGDPPSIV